MGFVLVGKLLGVEESENDSWEANIVSISQNMLKQDVPPKTKLGSVKVNSVSWIKVIERFIKVYDKRDLSPEFRWSGSVLSDSFTFFNERLS